MEHILLYGIIAMAISIVINLFLKKFGISQIIGYILTGTVIVYLFDLRHVADSDTLEVIAEFGIVFLMFTIGLEISLAKMGSMKRVVFGNGILQVGITALLLYVASYYIFHAAAIDSLIIALAFSLSSTAVVLSHLKSSKEIYAPYGQLSTGILIFQDIAVIPILLLIGFLSSDGMDIQSVLVDTVVSALLVLFFLFLIGKKIVNWLLRFSADSNIEELFVGSVLVIAVGASLLAHYAGFTYSLGAFVAGMIIAETRYHHKVEADIAPFKDLLLGTFFVTVGMKIDLLFFSHHIMEIILLLLAVLMLKSLIIYVIVRLNSSGATAMKTALALSQVGEFSFAIFALAGSKGLLDESVAQLLVLIVVLSMILTPFMISRINQIVGIVCRTAVLPDDFGMLAHRKDHVIVVGYSSVGKLVTAELRKLGVSYIIVDNNYKHVKEGLALEEEIYYGDVSKPSVLQALHVEDAAAVIVTLDNLQKKRLVCEAVLRHNTQANLVVKVTSPYEKEFFADLPITGLVESKREVARILVDVTMQCKL
jgi:CPA2 family monovalent cation:H+ antiporter-2